MDNVGNTPNIEIECGSVNASGMRLKDPPPALLETQAGTVSRTRIPSDPYLDPRQSRQSISGDPYSDPRQSRNMPPFSPLDPSRNLRSDFDRYLRMDEMEADEGPYDDMADRMMRTYDDAAGRMIPPLGGPPMLPRDRAPPVDPPPISRARAPRPRDPNPPPDFTNWKINIPDTPAPGIAVNPALKAAKPRSPAGPLAPRKQARPRPPADPVLPRKQAKEPRKVAPTVQAKTITKGRPVQRLGKGVVRQRIPNRKRVPTQKGPKKVVDEKPTETAEPSVETTDTGMYYKTL